MLVVGFVSARISIFGQQQDSGPFIYRLAAQNTIFEEQYQSDLCYSPERATAYGDYRYNDKLGEYSLAAITERYRTNQDFLSNLQAIATQGFSDQDVLSHDLLIRVLQQRIADYDLKEFEMPVNQMNGVHTSLADLPLSVPLDSVKHYEDYLARLHQIPRVLSQTTEVLRAGMNDKLMPVRYKLGQLKFRELRERAAKELGAKFDIRTFHDEMLNGGTLPLDMLDARTNTWIAEQKSK